MSTGVSIAINLIRVRRSPFCLSSSRINVLGKTDQSGPVYLELLR